MKTVLVIHAHPEPTSLTRHLASESMAKLQQRGHRVIESDLYAMGWKAVFDGEDFLGRAHPDRLSFIAESGHAYTTGTQTEDVMAEQRKVLEADAVIFHFPLWWYGMPAILKGWFDRVWAYGLAYGYANAGNQYRYGEGAFKGKRAILAVTTGGRQSDFSPRGINGPIEQLLFPITHGCLFFPGFDVLPSFVAHGVGVADEAMVQALRSSWGRRLDGLFSDAPMSFRSQNGGDYGKDHVLKDEVAPGVVGFDAHMASVPGPTTGLRS